MAEQLSRDQLNEIMFLNLVMMFQTSAMQQMGKLKNPVTDKVDRNLDQAQMSIEILDMLKVKTRGNLSEYEEKFLDRVISELKLNFVDEVDKDKKEEKGTTEERPAAEPEAERPLEPEAADQAQESKKKAKPKTGGKKPGSKVKKEPGAK